MRSLRPRHRRPALLAAAVLAALAVVPAVLPAVAAADVTTGSVDGLRTAWDRSEPGLSPAIVGSGTFGQLFSAPVTGQVYAQPVVARGTVVAATETNDVYGLDPVTGAQRWHRQLGPAWPAAAIGCGDLGPVIGITSTPVVDAAGTVYLTSKTYDGSDPRAARYLVHGLDAVTGTERPGWPLTVQGSPVNEPGTSFAAFAQMQRPALTLVGGTLYLGFASHCDFSPYRGYVVSVATGSSPRLLSLWATEAGTADPSPGGGIWQSGAGLTDDGAGHLLLTTGNGPVPPTGPGGSAPRTVGQSVVRLDLSADGSMRTGDFFAPYDADVLNNSDADLGSGGVSGLAPGLGTAAHPHLAVTAGKQGVLYLLDRDSLGGRGQGPGGGDAVLARSAGVGPLFGSVASWTGSGGYVYYPTTYGPLRAYRVADSGGVPALQQVGASPETLGFGSGSPLITSDGTTPGSALVWIVSSRDSTGEGAVLSAYDAVPVDGRLVRRWSGPIGTSTKFSRPASDAGRVYVGTRDGHLLGFGRTTPPVPLTGTAADLGSVDVGATAGGTVTLSAPAATTVSAVSAEAPFGAALPGLPRTLAAGQTLAVPVTFSPTAAGRAAGALTVQTPAGPLVVPLSGTGVSAALTATPAAVAFGNVPVGTSRDVAVTVTNPGRSAATLTSTTGPGAPFDVVGLPTAGAVVPPGASLGVVARFSPAQTGAASSALTLTAASGTVRVPLTGTGATPPLLSVTPDRLDYGSVPLGSSRTLSFTVANPGGSPLTLTLAKAPAGAFSTTTPLPEGLVLAPGQSRTQSVTFRPTATGPVTAEYRLNGDGGQGERVVTLTGSGGGPAVPPPTAGGWRLAGAAALAGPDLVLTPALEQRAGLALAPQPVPSQGLRVAFTAALGGGTGADGLALALLDPASAPAAPGAPGGGLGFSGLTGTAVTLDTWHGDGEPSGNFVGVSDGGTGDSVHYLATSTAVPDLRSGPHAVAVAVDAGRIRVSVDGVQVLDRAVALPAMVLPAFTAATGGCTDRHAVSGVSISAG